MLCLSLFFVVGIYSYVDYVGLFDSFLSIFQNEPSNETSGPLDTVGLSVTAISDTSPCRLL